MVKKVKNYPRTNKGVVWQKLLGALYADIGNVVSNEKLMKISGQHNYARRVRELRAEGWDIVYSASPTGYILRSTDKTSKNADVYINFKLRQKILERDRYTCQLCGHGVNNGYPDGESVKLEVDHITPLKQGGKTIEENLWTLCSHCNAGKKSLLDYPETIKNRIISLNLPDDIREKLSKLALQRGETINSLILDTIRRGIKELE
ncbi:MAG: HNH endonuclease [Patescibacteria group bacterium]